MEKVFRTRFETANRVYRYFRTGSYNFPILLGFDALRWRISSQGISCTNIQLLEMLNEIFTYEIFEFSTDGQSVDHRWPPMGKPPRKLISPHRWPLVVHRWPPMDFPGLYGYAILGRSVSFPSTINFCKFLILYYDQFSHFFRRSKINTFLFFSTFSRLGDLTDWKIDPC